jgi:hypothetical protein
MFASVAPREVLARLRRGVAKPQVKLLIGVSDPLQVQGSHRPYAMGWHTGAFASGAGNNEGILMVWRYAYTGPSAAWAHGEAPAWT